ncbi:hypothetical protein ASF29_03240 [Rhizobium sp. Leaf262]|nr:hypothetical protein ASF29_03240 [Rhizobium sp. Leaf262]
MYFLHFTQRTSSHSAGETLTLDESRNEPEIASQRLSKLSPSTDDCFRFLSFDDEFTQNVVTIKPPH